MRIFTLILRFVCSFLVIMMIAEPAFTQVKAPWMKALKNKKDPSFTEIRLSFNKYWKEKKLVKIPKGKGYKAFKRWEWFWEPRVGRSGKFPRPSVNMEEWLKYRASHPYIRSNSQIQQTSAGDFAMNGTLEAQSIGGAWQPLGPNLSDGGYGGIGRLNCIAFHPTLVNTFWVGSPSGGIWKTTNGGTTWTFIGGNLPVLGVSAIVVHPTNPDILYIATGDRDHADNFSVGVMKTTNGGVTWTPTKLGYPILDRALVKGLLMHPTNPSILIAATTRGMYRTTDGGMTTNWSRVSDIDFQEIVFKPGDPQTVYATGYADLGAQIFRSTDNGVSWNQVTSFDHTGRIALAVTKANPAVVGALCSNSWNSGFGGYYASVNSGQSFVEKAPASGKNLLGWDLTGADEAGQGWYDLCVAISPNNANIIYTGGVNTWKSTNGGTTWTISSMWYDGTGKPAVHADKHALAYNPLNTSTLYECNDGGLYKTSDGGVTWTDLSDGLQITQFYRLSTSATNAGLMIAGAQDNGTKIKNGTTYRDVIGGDGMEAIIDYSNANIMYASYQLGALYRSDDGGIIFNYISNGLPGGAWVTPYVIDPRDPQTLYAGLGYDLYKTTDRGNTWNAISDNLGFLQTVAVAPSNTQTIFAGTYWQLFKTTTGGSSWSTVTLPSLEGNVSIEIHPFNSQIVWISFSGYKNGEKVYRSDNGGSSWTNISGTLPNIPANTLEYDRSTGVLYLGTDLGVFVLPPGATDWLPFDAGLPNVIVSELEIQYSSRKLRAATYGRGLWESDLYPAPVPAISAFIPSTGAAGTGVLIKGTNFNNVTAVRVNGVAATTLYKASATMVYATVPAGATTGKLQVQAQGGTATTVSNLTVAPVSSKWIAKTGTSTSRIHHGTASVGGKIYLFGGRNSTTPINTLSIYNPATNSWGIGAPMPVANTAMAVTVGSDNLVYKFGGFTTTQVSTVYRYAPLTNAWTVLANMPVAVSEAAAAATSAGKIYVFGGRTATGTNASNSTRIYTIATNTWSSGANMPVALYQHSAVTARNGKIYIIGGRSSASGVPLGQVHIYNPSTNSWTSGASMPIPKVQFGATRATDSLIYVIGGKAAEPNHTGPYFHTVEVYNPTTNTWTNGPVLPLAFGHQTAVNVNDNVYAICGSDNVVRNYNYQLVNIPIAPSSLTATATSASQINLKWTDRSANEAAFSIERATVAAGPFTAITTTAANATTYSNIGLTANTTYYYRLKATNTGGSSVYSNVANAKTALAKTTNAAVVAHDEFEARLKLNGLGLLVLPNPVQISTMIMFTVSETQAAEVEVRDVHGRLVARIFKGIAEKNRTFSLPWNPALKRPGIYFAQLKTKSKTVSQKIVVMK